VCSYQRLWQTAASSFRVEDGDNILLRTCEITWRSGRAQFKFLQVIRNYRSRSHGLRNKMFKPVTDITRTRTILCVHIHSFQFPGKENIMRNEVGTFILGKSIEALHSLPITVVFTFCEKSYMYPCAWHSFIFLSLPLRHRASVKRFIWLQFLNLTDNR
jgi:hypothetical protein